MILRGLYRIVRASGGGQEMNLLHPIVRLIILALGGSITAVVI